LSRSIVIAALLFTFAVVLPASAAVASAHAAMTSNQPDAGTATLDGAASVWRQPINF
jgi:hypothetical protein